MNLSILLTAAIITGFVHTITGPDHYLPFIVIAKSRHYRWRKTILWTLFCGLAHIGSAILLAAGFLLFAEFLKESQLAWFEEWRGCLAAYALVGMGGAILLRAQYVRWKKRPHTHRHVHWDGSVTVHQHRMSCDHAESNEKNLSYWVIFLIFVFGPCEALFPLLTASAMLGMASVILTAVVFSAATILTMLTAVSVGLLGMDVLRFKRIEDYAPEIAGCTVMTCGLAILCFGL